MSEPHQGTPVARSSSFAAAAWVAGVLFVLVFATPFVLREHRSGDRWSGPLMQAELNARIATSGLLPPDAARRNWEQVDAALTAHDAPAGAIARALVAAQERSRTPSEAPPPTRIAELLARLRTAPTQLAPEDRAAMERALHAVYDPGGPLTPAQADALYGELPRLHLGWFASLLRAHLDERAGREVDAQRRRAAVRASARKGLLGGAAVITAMFLLGVLGLVSWVLYFVRVRGPRKGAWPAPLADATQAAPLLWGLNAYLGLAYAAGWIRRALAHAGVGGGRASWLLSFGLQLGAESVALVVLLALLKRARMTRAHAGLAIPEPARQLAWGVAGYAATLPVLAVTMIVGNALLRRLPNNPHPVAGIVAGEPSTAVLVAVTLFAALIGPLFEEIFFRGALLNAIWARTGSPVLAALVSSALFAVIHPQLVIGWLAVFVLGVMLAGLFIERRSVVAGTILHCLNNGASLLVMLLLFGRAG